MIFRPGPWKVISIDGPHPRRGSIVVKAEGRMEHHFHGPLLLDGPVIVEVDAAGALHVLTNEAVEGERS